MCPEKVEQEFQSTLPYGERQQLVVAITTLVSFNPRSRMGSDRGSGAVVPLAESFNPRSRMGSDAKIVTITLEGEVSIHAPVWGATSLKSKWPRCKWFQSTLPYGERQTDRRNSIRRGGFNPRSRMGSDVAPTPPKEEITCFNPRSRMGSDDLGAFCSCKPKVSIHAPVWGATPATT